MQTCDSPVVNENLFERGELPVIQPAAMYFVGNPLLGKSYCDRNFQLRDGSAECDLPEVRAASLYSLLKQADQRCLAEVTGGTTR